MHFQYGYTDGSYTTEADSMLDAQVRAAYAYCRPQPESGLHVSIECANCLRAYGGWWARRGRWASSPCRAATPTTVTPDEQGIRSRMQTI